jgi:hypothetical protein
MNSYGPRIVTDGLVLCLDAADRNSYPGSGTNWGDLSGNGNTGTLVNGVGYSGSNLGSFTFDGGNDYITTSYDLSWNNTNSMSLFLTLTPSNITQKRPIIGKGPSAWEWQLNQIEDDLELVYWNNAGGHSNGPITKIIGVFENNTPISVGIVWNHIDNKHYFYKNGTYIGQNTWTNASINQNRTTGINIGGNIYAWSLGGSFWLGIIHNVTIYNRSLTAQEIQQNYQATKGRFGL